MPETPETANEEIKQRKKRWTVKEANAEGERLAKQLRTFALLSVRQQSSHIGCAWETWNKTSLCKSIIKCREKLAANNSAATQSPGTVRDAELDRLTNEQRDDYEPSSLDDSPVKYTRPTVSGRRVIRSKHDLE